MKLSGESAVDNITLDGVRGLRVTLSATVHDVLYYMSPIYCQHIIDSVSNQLNKLYAKFLKRNPNYSGKVSLYGHSLGSVLSYDILCHQDCSTFSTHMDSVCTQDNTEYKLQTDEHFPSFINDDATVLKVNKPIFSCGALEKLECQPATAPPPEVMPDDCLKSAVFSYTDDDLLDLVRIPSEEEQCISASLLDANEEKPNIKSKFRFYTSEKVSNANFDLEENFAVNEVKDTDLLCKDTTVKENLISLLKEEVNSLQKRIAELEKQTDSSSSLPKNNGDISKECSSLNVAGDKIWACKDQLSLKKPEQGVSAKHFAPYRYTKLDFKVDTFFAVGSPLGVFLSLRNVRIGIGKGHDYWQDENMSEEMPSCRQMFNIFHPFDPVAYRVEPLICKEYICKRPVIIPYHRGGKRLHIGFQEFTDDIAACTQAMIKDLNSLKVKIVNVFQSKGADDLEAVEDIQEKEQPYGSLMIERLTGDENGRVDHVLQDKTFRHPYISALGAHTNYWRDPDTALFILKHLYRDIPEEPHDGMSAACSSNTEKPPVTLFYEKDFLDEDLPLTFSDYSLIRDFSRKAKKAMQSS